MMCIHMPACIHTHMYIYIYLSLSLSLSLCMHTLLLRALRVMQVWLHCRSIFTNVSSLAAHCEDSHLLAGQTQQMLCEGKEERRLLCSWLDALLPLAETALHSPSLGVQPETPPLGGLAGTAVPLPWLRQRGSAPAISGTKPPPPSRVLRVTGHSCFGSHWALNLRLQQ